MTRDIEMLKNDGLIEVGPCQTTVWESNLDSRSKDVIEILCGLPDVEYEAFKLCNPWFFSPAYGGVFGCCFEIPQGKQRVVYLSPELECRSGETQECFIPPPCSGTNQRIKQFTASECRLIVAHEIMHAVLDHPVCPSDVDLPRIEKEAWDTVIRLGFGQQNEVRALRVSLGLLLDDDDPVKPCFDEG